MGTEMEESTAANEVSNDHRSWVECRACLTKTLQSTATDIFSDWTWKFQKHVFTSTIAMEMEKLAKVEILNIEGYPDHVCQKCEAWLQGAIMLIKDVKASDKILKSKDNTWPKPIKLAKSLNGEVIQLVDDVEVKQENVSEDDPIDDGMDDAQEAMETDDVDIKEEPQDICDQPTIQVTVNDGDAGDGNDPLITLSSKAQPRRSRKEQIARGKPFSTGDHQSCSENLDTQFVDSLKLSLLKLRIEKSSDSIGPACNCKKDCSKIFSDAVRTQINLHFWSLKQVDKYKFLMKFTERSVPKSRSPFSIVHGHQYTYQYYLPLNNIIDDTPVKMRVCKIMFDNTLLIKYGIVQRLWERYSRPKKEKEKRGKPVNTKITKAAAKKHLQKFLRGSGSDSKCLLKDKLYTKKLAENICSKVPRVVLTKIDSADNKLDINTFKVEIEIDLKNQKLSEQCAMPNNNDLESNASGDETDYSNFSDELQNEYSKTVNDLSEKADVSGTDYEHLNSDFSETDLNQKEQITRKVTRQNPDPNPVLDITEFPKDFVEKIEQGQIKELLTDKKKMPTKDPAVIRRYCRNHGLEYVTMSGKVVPKKVLLPQCNCKGLKCSQNISEDQRQRIFEHFWGLGNRKKQDYFIKHFTERLPTILQQKRGFFFKCYLPITEQMDASSNKVNVCRRMFCNTIACRYAQLVYVWNRYDTEEPITSNKPGAVHDVDAYDHKATGSDFDNTYIDFVYRAMPFDEFMACFSSKKTITKADEIPIGEARNVNMFCCKKRADYKRRKLLGKSYVNKQGDVIEEKKLGPSCDCTMLRCGMKISEEQRRFIFEYYWTLGDLAKQRAFTIRFSRRISAKRPRRRSITDKDKIRMTYEYFLPLTGDFDGEQVKVCKVMFLNTLAIGDRVMQTNWLKFAFGSLEERRGKGYSKILLAKLKPEMVASVIDHFNSLINEDPDMKEYKINTSYGKRFMFNVIYKKYLKWFDSTKYGSTVKNSYMYRNIIEGKYDKYFEPKE